MEGLTDQLTRLEFIKSDPDGRGSCWEVTPAESWTAQNEQGAAYARAFIDHLNKWGPGPTLGRIAADQAKHGTSADCGVRDGFWNVISTSLWQGKS